MIPGAILLVASCIMGLWFLYGITRNLANRPMIFHLEGFRFYWPLVTAGVFLAGLGLVSPTYSTFVNVAFTAVVTAGVLRWALRRKRKVNSTAQESEAGEDLAAVERRLVEQGGRVFREQGLGPAEAEEAVKEMLKQVRETAVQRGTIDRPRNYGDILLHMEGTNDAIRSRLSRKRSDGVTDMDIRVYWNLHELERGMLLSFHTVGTLGLYAKCRDDGMTEAEASRLSYRLNPQFDDLERDTGESSDPNRPLPCELVIRVNTYLSRRRAHDFLGLNHDIEAAGTVNALIRKEISSGSL